MKVFNTTRYSQTGALIGQQPPHSQQNPVQPQGQGMEVEPSDPDLEHEQALEHQEQQVLNVDHNQGGMERLPGGIKPPGESPAAPEANVDAWHPEQEQTAYPAGTQRKPPGQWPAGGLDEAFNQNLAAAKMPNKQSGFDQFNDIHHP